MSINFPIANSYPTLTLQRLRRVDSSVVALFVLFILSSCGALGRPSLAPYSMLRHTMDARGKQPRVVFLGTSSIAFDDGETAFMIDGFFTRPSPGRALLGRLTPDDARIAFALQQASVNRLSAVLVAHSHYDHALDAPRVAALTGATVMGSHSTANIARGAGLSEDRIRVLEDNDRIKLGRFVVTAFETPHSPDIRFAGTIERPLRIPARIRGYREGGNYSFLVEHRSRRILVVPSANYRPGRFRHIQVDVIFLSIGALGQQSCAFAQHYWDETVRATNAQLVVPIHWDDFTLPLSQPIVPMRRAVDPFEKAMRYVLDLASRDKIPVRLPQAFAAIDLDQRAESGVAAASPKCP